MIMEGCACYSLRVGPRRRVRSGPACSRHGRRSIFHSGVPVCKFPGATARRGRPAAAHDRSPMPTAGRTSRRVGWLPTPGPLPPTCATMCAYSERVYYPSPCTPCIWMFWMQKYHVVDSAVMLCSCVCWVVLRCRDGGGIITVGLLRVLFPVSWGGLRRVASWYLRLLWRSGWWRLLMVLAKKIGRGVCGAAVAWRRGDVSVLDTACTYTYTCNTAVHETRTRGEDDAPRRGKPGTRQVSGTCWTRFEPGAWPSRWIGDLDG